MVKKKLIYVIGSIIIGFISIIGIFFVLTASGIISTEQARVVIATASAEKEYDGTALICQEWSIADGQLKEGHVANVTVTGTATEVGEFENYATVTITDHVGADVTEDYQLDVQFGKLTVHKRRMTLQSESAEKIYDGAPMEMGTVTMVEDRLIAGHVLQTTKQETSVNAGSYQNLFTATILDKDERDVTHNYELTCDYGTLEIKPKKITVTTEDISKEYDGVALTATTGSLSEKTPLLEGHKIEFTANASIKDAGTVDHAVLATVFFDEEDVTDNYDIDYQYGRLTVHKRVLTIVTNNANKTYDGTDISNETYTCEGTLLDGHELKVTFLNSHQTEAGQYQNTVSACVVAEENGEEVDVSYNYDIRQIKGTLTISQREITVRSGSDEKDYDGTPLDCPDWNVVSINNVIDGHVLEVVVSGQQLSVGSSSNYFGQIRVMLIDEDGEYVDDVTRNYKIKEQWGTLTVKGTDASDSGGGGMGGGTPPSGDLKEGSGSADDVVCLEVYSEKTDKVYLRYASYGEYAGSSWDPGKEYTELLDDTYAYTYLFSIALKNAEEISYEMAIKDYTDAYYLPYYTQLGVAGYQIQTSDVVCYGQDSTYYSLYYYSYDFGKLGLDGLYGVNLGSNYTALAKDYEVFVRDNYLSVPTDTREYFETLIAEQDFDQNDENIIAKVAKYIQGAATYNLKYDKALDNETDIAVSFLRDYKEGVCRHYASAATLLYRTLGIPARYVTGFLANTKADTWTEVKGSQGHAWVEVYVSGYGWVQVEVTGGSSGGIGGDDGEDGGIGGGSGGLLTQMTITPVKVAVQADGSNCAEAKNEVTGGKEFNAMLKDGYTYEVEVSGRRETYGKGKSTVEEFKFYNPNKELVYHYLQEEVLINEEELDISFKNGILHLYIETLTFTSRSASKTYDGKFIEVPQEYDWTGALKNGHSIAEVNFINKQLNAGKTPNNFTVKIVDEEGTEITSWYNIVKNMGTLTVHYRTIELTAQTKYLDYGGSVNRWDEWDVTGGSVAENQTLTARMEDDCYLDDYGLVANVIDLESIKIEDEWHNDVTSNYIITTKDGMLIMR